MPASSLAQILLRVFALSWVISGCVHTVSVFMMENAPGMWIYHLGPSLTTLVAGVVVWFVAPPLSRLVAKRNDGAISLQGVDETQLYATALLVLGLYFALSSFGSVLSWIHYFAIVLRPQRKSPDPDRRGRARPQRPPLGPQALTEGGTGTCRRRRSVSGPPPTGIQRADTASLMGAPSGSTIRAAKKAVRPVVSNWSCPNEKRFWGSNEMPHG
ncbi:hypothetical protein BH23VER1_BH23VER1_37410 [soil metagenome]